MKRSVAARIHRSLRHHSAHHRRHAALKHRVRTHQPLHIRLALHPISLFALLLVGVLITGWTLQAQADSYTVSGKVPAAALSEGAVITSPTDGTTVTSNSILVEGTCPDASYVTLTRNNVFSGVAVCSAGHTFTISTALSAGANELVAQDFNITDDPGPATPSVVVHYNPPESSGGTSSGSNSSTGGGTGHTVQPLLLVSDYRFRAISLDQAFSWNVIIKGGTAPYTMTIDWGDDNQTLNTYGSARLVTISHVYTSPGYFTIIVNISDAQGNTTTLQLIAFVKVPGASGILFANGNTSPPLSSGNPLLETLATSMWLLVAWPSYVVLTLMVVSFWLGERQQIHRLLVAQLVRSRSLPRARH